VTRLHFELNGVLAGSELRRQIVELGMVPAPNRSPEQLQDFINAEMLRWGKVVQQAGLAGSE
jgi:tripartite-type tricarboxylate transporter receptor subunit TctC